MPIFELKRLISQLKAEDKSEVNDRLIEYYEKCLHKLNFILSRLGRLPQHEFNLKMNRLNEYVNTAVSYDFTESEMLNLIGVE